MLTFEAPFYEINKVIVFRDHASKSTFYYLAGVPHLSRGADGQPEFLLLKYRNALDAAGATTSRMRDQLGGGFLLFGVDCGLSPEQKDDLAHQIASQAPDAGDNLQLVPVLYTRGTVKVVALDYQTPADGPPGAPAGPAPTAASAAVPAGSPSHMIRGVVGSAVPSLLQDQRAIFSIALDPEAVTLLENCYDDDLAPIGVVYNLEFAGLRPSVSVHAVVDEKRVYEKLAMELKIGVRTQSRSDTQPAGTTPAGTTPAGTTPAGTTPSGLTPAGLTPAGGNTPRTPDPIVVRIKTAGALGAMTFTTKVGSGAESAPVTSSAPANNQPFKYAVPSTQTRITFPAGTYVESASYTVTFTAPTTATITQPGGASPAITQETTAPPPAAVTNATGARPPPATGTGNNASQTQVGLDVDLTYMVEKLRDEGAIQIQVIRQQEGKSAEDMEKLALDLVKDQVIKDFFKPTLNAQPSAPAVGAGGIVPANNGMATTAQTSPGAAGNNTRVDIAFALQYRKSEELKTTTYDFSAQAPETRTHAPNAFFSALVTRTDRARVIRTIDLDDPFFRTLDVKVSTAADFAALDLKTAVVDLAYGGTVTEPKVLESPTFTAQDVAPKGFQAFLEDGEMAYRYRVRYEFGEAELVAAQRSSYATDWRASLSRALVVNPPDDVAMLNVYVDQGVIDWDLVDRVETRVTYDDPENGFHAERTFLVGADFKRQTWAARLTNAARTAYKVKHTWFLKSGRRLEGGETECLGAQVFVPDPFVDRIPVLIQPEVDPLAVQRITVSLHYVDGDNQLDVRKLVDMPGPNFHPQVVALPLMDATRRTFSYQVTVLGAGGAAENGAETSTDRPLVLVRVGAVQVDVTVQLLGDVAQSHLLGLQVDLRARPVDGQQAREESHLFEPGGDKRWTQKVAMRTDTAEPTYQYRTSLFRADRDPEQGDWTDARDPLLTLQVARLVTP